MLQQITVTTAEPYFKKNYAKTSHKILPPLLKMRKFYLHEQGLDNIQEQEISKNVPILYYKNMEEFPLNKIKILKKTS
ncbi:hypothetical protein V9J15_01520 [Candidatus Liberibacter africanus]|uniref:Uncharacterized protein n=1 Tax=Candidatus Liberibacter africanus PTSAPSY TaxID=1277257 RepID=A0A0G3I4K3_LIBAF|nr:hypothetical protein [Candidatus Liberibacter africanus]AKK20175.1 hypothetical protein G293_02735 [Candidatus Liberibacter africanus PTSAPSY]